MKITIIDSDEVEYSSNDFKKVVVNSKNSIILWSKESNKVMEWKSDEWEIISVEE